MSSRFAFAATELGDQRTEAMKTARLKFRAVFIRSSMEVPTVSGKDFLLYPLDTGKDPVCLACGKAMVVAAVEESGDKPSFIAFRCMHCGRTEKFLCE